MWVYRHTATHRMTYINSLVKRKRKCVVLCTQGRRQRTGDSGNFLNFHKMPTEAWLLQLHKKKKTPKLFLCLWQNLTTALSARTIAMRVPVLSHARHPRYPVSYIRKQTTIIKAIIKRYNFVVDYNFNLRPNTFS